MNFESDDECTADYGVFGDRACNCAICNPAPRKRDLHRRLTEALRLQMEAKHKEAEEARLWFSKAQEWKEALRAAEEREKGLREALEPFVAARLLIGGEIIGLERWHFDRARAALKDQPHD